MDRNTKIRHHFDNETFVYDEVILTVVPQYKKMLEVLIQNFPFDPNAEFEVMDLGVGTGTLSHLIKLAFPNARLTGVDFSKRMLQKARTRLAKFDHIDFLEAEFSTMNFSKKFDVIVASLSLHHLPTDDEKYTFYQKIYHALNDNGIFLNADAVLEECDLLQSVNTENWKKFMVNFHSKDSVENEWFTRFQEEDNYAILTDQLDWFRQIGFRYRAIFWKYYNFAVFGAIK